MQHTIVYPRFAFHRDGTTTVFLIDSSLDLVAASFDVETLLTAQAQYRHADFPLTEQEVLAPTEFARLIGIIRQKLRRRAERERKRQLERLVRKREQKMKRQELRRRHQAEHEEALREQLEQRERLRRDKAKTEAQEIFEQLQDLLRGVTKLKEEFREVVPNEEELETLVEPVLTNVRGRIEHLLGGSHGK